MEQIVSPENQPLVSIIMPAYNAERYIEEAVRSAMAQTVTDWELLIIDDCSGDSTCSVAERLAREDKRIALFHNEENLGAAGTRNRGLELCRGKYVALLDSDDVWHPDKLEKQLERLRQTGADLSYSSYAVIGEDGKKAKGDYIVPENASFKKMLKENVIGCSTVLLDARIAKQYRFDTSFFHEDYVLWLRLLRDGYTAAGCGEVLVDWRYIESSRSFDKQKSARNRWKIYREYLKLPLPKSLWAFSNYAATSLRKYLRRG